MTSKTEDTIAQEMPDNLLSRDFLTGLSPIIPYIHHIYIYFLHRNYI